MLKYLLCRTKQLEKSLTDSQAWEKLCREMSQYDVEIISIDTIYSMENLQALLSGAGFPAKSEAAGKDLKYGMPLQAQDTLVLAVEQQDADWARELQLAVVGYELADTTEHLQGVQHIIQGFEEIDYEFLDHCYLRCHNLPWTIFYTRRCVVREITLADMEELFLLYKKDHVTDYIEPLYAYEEELAYERSYIRHMYGYYGYGMWIVRDRITNQLIGRAGIDNREYDGKMELEMGYVIDPEYQRQGYATEVCEGIIEWVRQNLTFERINCLVEEGNRSSIGLLCKLGFARLEDITEEGKKYCRYIFSLE